MRTVAMIVSYDGTAYSGFQSQPQGQTVQDEIQLALQRLTGEAIKIDGSGRTDAGVHAYGQVFSFITGSPIPMKRFAMALNGWLPNDIIVRSAHEMPAGFHARIHAVRKTYRYSITTGKYPNVFTNRYRFHHYNPLDVDAMREAIVHLLGEHDFSSFTSAGSTKRSHVRTIHEVRIEQDGDDIHTFVTGNGFLYNMVRIIMGTLMWVGEGKWKPERMSQVIKAMDRSQAGPKAGAQGLTLWEVGYPEPFSQCLQIDPANDL
ncbi:tRNA pseudouridine(38-40) synthase TruA [Paenibacillus tarimensis]|uniref:tRNA pseudouridine(38-40) synthase TruA n=1 Tax=Paenibacillus tarimensis TaxID=416012 RepID=UPI001F349319|nr:tRNA pseudouridine(38-40) synthase TruA [Paenibacillus tarimensis]MCF2946107.1 tRNA pseudouridine(38-40) synthase TruA [Paenibacillus tarimensis]